MGAFNRRKARALCRYPSAGRGRHRRAAAVRHPLAWPVIDGVTQRPPWPPQPWGWLQ